MKTNYWVEKPYFKFTLPLKNYDYFNIFLHLSEPITEYTPSLINGQRGSWNYCKLKRFCSKNENFWRTLTEGRS